MKVLSVSVGLPREVEWKGRLVQTSIFKAPVSDRVRVSKLNLEGDQQSGLSVHGGVDKAVYGDPSEHYKFWRNPPRTIMSRRMLIASPLSVRYNNKYGG
jgi:MOSC domain-containing protein YiiM